MAALANNLVFLNNGLFDGFPSIVIPSLIGLNTDLNPDETLRITSSQASWIGTFYFFYIKLKTNSKKKTFPAKIEIYKKIGRLCLKKESKNYLKVHFYYLFKCTINFNSAS